MPEHWEYYVLARIDGKPLNPLQKYLRDGYGSASWSVRSGRHQLVLKAQFNDKAGADKTYSAYVTLDFMVQPFSRYQVQGEIKGDKAYLWLIDPSTGNTVSPVLSSTYQASDEDDKVKTETETEKKTRIKSTIYKEDTIKKPKNNTG